MALLLYSLLLAIYFFLLMPLKAKKNFRRYKALSEPVKVTIQDNGIHFKRENGEILVPWAYVEKWRYNKALILLYPTGNIFYMLPRHLFSPTESFQELQTILVSKCGKAN
jgi:hypothetical protein